MIFETFGAFSIPLDCYGNIPDNLSEFWTVVETEKNGLSNAKGCYIFGIRTSGGPAIMPWYVGKTSKAFAKECFQHHKRNNYNKALNRYKRATPCLFLISRLTKGGGFYKGSGALSTNFLERHLISLALQANTELLNKKDTKLYRELQLRGILNSEGKRNQSAKELRLALRIPK